MLRRFSSGISPLKYEKRMHKNTSALQSTFRRVNLSLAGCSSAEPASVSVQNKIQCIKLYLQTVEKANHVHYQSARLTKIVGLLLYLFQLPKQSYIDFLVSNTFDMSLQ